MSLCRICNGEPLNRGFLILNPKSNLMAKATPTQERIEFLSKKLDKYTKAKKKADKEGIKCKTPNLTKSEKEEMSAHLKSVIEKYHPRS